MSAPLDALIAERLGISEEEARNLLRAMVEEIRTRAEDDGVQLPRLGTFREENGTISFTPSSSLERLVNRQYEGLPSEEAAVPPGAETVESRREDPEEEEPDRPKPEETEKSGIEPDESVASGQAPDYPLVEDDLRYDSGQPTAADTEGEDDTSEFERATDHPSEAEETAEPEEEPEESQPARRPSIADSFQVILGILLLVFLVAAGWFVLRQTRVLSPGPGGNTQPSPPTEPTADTVLSETDEEVAAREDTTTEQTGPTRFPGTTPGDQEPRDAIAPGAGGWTIVVASTPDRSVAEKMRDRYRQQFSGTGLPVDIVTGTVNNATRYRVSLGQYSSRDAVLRALDEHAARLPEGAWVLQL